MSNRSPTKRLPVAVQIEEILSERIRDGVYPASTQLPSEQQLSEEFGVSWAAIRTAFDGLASNRLGA